jgi:DNA-binding winged helix-turn-helix (wHTH) protein/Tol biopolymer transport system component
MHTFGNTLQTNCRSNVYQLISYLLLADTGLYHLNNCSNHDASWPKVIESIAQPNPMRMSSDLDNSKFTFGRFEVNRHSGELRRGGFRIKLQSQPFKVLEALLEKPGQVVSRDELQERIWGKDTVVDFDHSLGTAINKVREALGDSADNPRFIETLSRRGYRFIAPVAVVSAVADPQLPAVSTANSLSAAVPQHLPGLAQVAVIDSALGEAPPQSGGPAQQVWQRPRAQPNKFVLLAICAVVLLCLGCFYLGVSHHPTVPPHITQITHNGHLWPSVNSMEDLAAAVTDGVHIYASTLESGHSALSSIDINGGQVEPISLPAEVASPALGDISQDGSQLLLRDHLSPESEQPLWVVPTGGGSALRIGNIVAHDATWMPDGESILFANGTDLYLTSLSQPQPQHYAALIGRAFWLRWDPKGKILRFTILDPLAHTLSLWQLSPRDHVPHRILAGFNQPAGECCGVWTADGSAYVFQSTKGGGSNLWKLTGTSAVDPVRLTDGPLDFESPVAARSGSRIFFMGADSRSELDSLNQGSLSPVKGFLTSAVRFDYSRDAKWVVWTDTEGHLWRARADGSEKLQLTPDNIYAFLARWSPDGSRIVVMAREAGKAWQIYITVRDGGDLQPLLRQVGNAADPSWSSDGKAVLFGGTNDVMGKDSPSRLLRIVRLSDGAVQPVPGSEGLFSPRWSPDGRYIAALSLDQQQVRLYTLATRTWTTLNVSSGADPIWSADSRYLFIHASLDPSQPIDRISIPDGHVDTIAHLADAQHTDAVDFVFCGLAPDKTPYVRTRIFTGNFYSLDLK